MKLRQGAVLDQSILASSDLHAEMNGYQRFERLRTSRLRRLQQMPFILVCRGKRLKKSVPGHALPALLILLPRAAAPSKS